MQNVGMITTVNKLKRYEKVRRSIGQQKFDLSKVEDVTLINESIIYEGVRHYLISANKKRTTQVKLN